MPLTPIAVKTYKALLTQSGTDAPVPTIIQNTLGETLTWTYTATGIYTATGTKPIFKENKVFINVGNGAGQFGITGADRVLDNTDTAIFIQTTDTYTQTNADNCLLATPITIEVHA